MLSRIALALALVVGLAAAAPAPPSSTTTPLQQLYVLKQVKPDIKSVGIVWNGKKNHADVMPLIQRAGASSGVKVFVVAAERNGDVAAALRKLIRQDKVDALWVVREDGLIEREPSRSYLIGEAVKGGIPVLTPSADWVSDGASLAVFDKGGQLRVALNKPVAQALGLKVPADLAQHADFVAAR